MSREIRMSVRKLVEFLFRAGDLDSRGMGAADEAMLEGARVHRRLQKEAGPSYQAEVPLRFMCPVPETEDAYLILEGRADGIFCGYDPDFPLAGEAYTIDEIKSTYRKLSSIKEPVPVHLAQAKCYAYIYAVQNGLGNVRVRMTYCSLISGEILYFYEEYSRKEIEDWFDGLMREFGRWARLELSWKEERTASMHALEFPFDYRPGQRELAVHVYHTICHGRKLFLEAPTGTGKTLSVLFPALKAIGEGKADKVFYLTAKNVTGKAAADALELLRKHGLRCKSVFLTAKDKVCVLDTPQCDPEHCPRARGHYDRINDVLYEILTGEETYDREFLMRRAMEREVCPFELALDLSLFCDAVIGDYNYLFDPKAKLRRFFADGGKGPYIFLIDEAHNLVDRGREMYSASLRREELESFCSKMKKPYPKLREKALPCLRALDSLILTSPGREGFTEDVVFPEEIGAFTQPLYVLDEEIRSVLAQQRKQDRKPLSAQRQKVQDDLLDLFFRMDHFLEMYEGMEEDYVVYAREGGKDAGMFLYCVDPARNLGACMKGGTASILFSATFFPIQYYKRLLGGQEEDYEVCADSVFDPERRAVFIASDITTRYRARSAEQYERIAAFIHRAVSQRHGNYMVFFPSYAFMEEVVGRYAAMHPQDDETAWILQTRQMKEQDRRDFLERFEEVHDDRSLLGFCVLGGVFSEGIDLRRDRLIGVIVVGTGYPQVCAEREILKEYFSGRGEDGFGYAYRIPGMNKVLQAAGRVIRTTSDVGVVILADGRFLSDSHRRLFPPDWNGGRLITTEDVGERVSRFWDEWL